MLHLSEGSRCSWSGSLKFISALRALTLTKTPNALSESLLTVIASFVYAILFMLSSCYTLFDT